MVMLSRSMANFISVARSTDGGFQKSGAMSGLKYEATKRSGASFIVKKLRQFGLEEPPPKKKKKCPDCEPASEAYAKMATFRGSHALLWASGNRGH